MLSLLLASFVIVAFAATAQAVSGFGFALVSVPLLALVVDAHTAVVSVTTVSFVLSSYVARRERAHVAWRPARVVSAAALVGIPLGLLVLTTVTERQLAVLVSVVVLTFAALLSVGFRVARGLGVEIGAGVLSGALLASTGMNGPPLVAAFQAIGMPPRTFRATMQVAFTVQSVMAVTGLLLTRQYTAESVAVLAAAVPGLAVGWLLGDRLFRRLAAGSHRRVVLGVLFASGLVSLVRALGG